jgi:hypothetical protein
MVPHQDEIAGMAAELDLFLPHRAFNRLNAASTAFKWHWHLANEYPDNIGWKPMSRCC